jgi:aconitase B
MLTLMPAFLLDVVRFSNRFAGPIVRLRRFLRELGENGEVPPLKFRDDDFWMEIAKEFNVCRERIYRQRMEIERLQALLNENAIDWTDWSAESQSKNSSNVTV